MNNTDKNILGVHHVALVVKDFDSVVGFYQELGFTKYLQWGEFGERKILLDSGNGSFVEIFESAENKPEGQYAHLAFAVADVDVAYASAIKAGAKAKIAPKVVELASEPEKATFNCAFVYGLGGEVVEFFRRIK